MRCSSKSGRVVASFAIAVLFGGVMAPLVHTVQHDERDDDCVVCLAHVGSPAVVRESVPLAPSSCVKHWTVPDRPSKRHAGHGSPFSGRAPPRLPSLTRV